MNELLIPISAVMSMVAGLCSNCQEVVRQTIARNQVAQKTTDRRLQRILEEASIDFRVPEAEIINGGNHRELVRVRREIVVKAREQGFSYPKIGSLLKRHHTTIMHLDRTRDINYHKRA